MYFKDNLVQYKRIEARTPTSRELLLFKNHTLLHRMEAPGSSPPSPRSKYIITSPLSFSLKSEEEVTEYQDTPFPAIVRL